MRVFVTGGSGFLGKNLIKMLKDRGDDVRALAISEKDAAICEEAGAETIIGNLDQSEVLKKGLQGCDVVIHSAAIMKLMADYETLYHVNVEGTRNLIEAAKSAGIKRFIHIAAVAALSGGKPVKNADETWEIPKKPVGAYAKTKAIGEKIALSYHSSAFEVLVIRPPCIWGLGDQAMLPGLTEVAAKGKFLWVAGGDYLFAVCHVRNVCEGILLAIEKGRGGEVYFLTDGPRTNFREFFDALIRTQGVDPGEKTIPRWMASILAPIVEFIWRSLRLKNAAPFSREAMALLFSPLWVNDNKARRELGYKGHVSREEGLAELRAEADHLKQ